ncbi:MAG: hypothetical protein KGJ90_04190 [Patescibacteria group bacterium]|nr:hypothetical protein [Patescibacteria group bacterium]
MIQPINRNYLVKPLAFKSFLPTEREKFEQVGVVLALPGSGADDTYLYSDIEVGDRVYFDSWLAGKYENPDSTSAEDKWYWLVDFNDIKAMEKPNDDKNKISE